jgi:fatty-acyl-CoA synthase
VWLDAIHRHRGTITYAPNFAYALVAKRLKDKDVQGLDLSCIRIAGCGAEPIQAKTLRDFADRLKPAGFNPKAYIPSYGMAEATLAISFAPHGRGFSTDTIDPESLQTSETKPSSAEGAQELVCCGKAFPDHEIAIIDEQGKRLGERQVGQIVTTGPSISSGYFNEPELTEESFKTIPGDPRIWLHTGDLGYFVDGSVYICGRLKDIIIIRGRNFYPNDIEWVASELPGVRRGNVVAFGVTVDAQGGFVEDGTGEEQLVVCAEAFSGDAEKLVTEIQQAVTEQIGIAVWKVEMVPQGGLPRTSSGKPQRRKTKRMFIDGTLPKRATAFADPSST